MISQTAEYALRAVIHMAKCRESSLSTRQIADATEVPIAYLSKVLQSLTKAGVIHSHRGLKGGFSLVKPPEDITVYDVINAVDPMKRIESCPLKNTSHGKNLCPLHRRLDSVLEATENAFRSTTLAELL